MNKKYNPTLLDAVVSGPGMKYPRKPSILLGTVGEFAQGDLMDANAVLEAIDDAIEGGGGGSDSGLSEKLDKEIQDREAAIDNLQSSFTSTLQGYVNSGSYNSSTKKIELKHDNTVLAAIDATAFISTGMVDSVVVENGNLVITFNTELGEETVSIPLSQIFDPNNYYNKSEVDTALGNKQDIISDLANIRSGAQAGSTAVQTSALNDVVKNTVAESGVYDVSANNDNTKFESLSALLSSANLNTLIPTDVRKGGMSIKFIQLTPATYTVVKTEGVETQPTGNEVQEALSLENGTYTAAQMTGVTPPASGSVTYYLAVTVDETTTYTTWVITKATSDVQKYVQYRYMETVTTAATFTNIANWQGVDDEPTANSNNLVKSGGVYEIKKHLETVNSYVGAIYENDEGKDTLTSQRTTDGTRKSIFYKKSIPNSEIVVFELNTDGDLYEGLNEFYTAITVEMSDNTTKSFLIIPNQKYFFKATNGVFISTVTAYYFSNYKVGVNINAKVHTGAYAQYLLAKEEERIDSYYNDDIEPEQILTSKYINSSGVLTSVTGQVSIKTKIYDVEGINGLLVHVRGSYSIASVNQYLWSIFSNDEMTVVLEHSNKHSINSATSNTNDIICSDEFVIPQGARYLAVSAVVVDDIPSNECYLMRANSTIPVFALETAREAERKAEIKTLNRNLYAGIAIWGSSTFQSSWVQNVAKELKVGYYWGGCSGEPIWSQMARMGALPMTITDSITIPSEKGSEVVIPQLTATFKDTIYDLTPHIFGTTTRTLVNPCIVAGVKCSITRTQQGIILTRLEDGDAITTNPNEWVYTYGFANTRDSVWLLACHYNVGFTSGDGKLPLLLECYKRIYDTCASKKVLILGRHKCKGSTNEERAQARDYQIEQDDLLASEFGLMFFNTRKYLCTYGFALAKQRFADDPEFVVTEDNEYQASVGITPECFYDAWDNVHLNTYGQSVLTTGIVNTMKALGYDKFRQGGDNPFPTEYEQYV